MDQPISFNLNGHCGVLDQQMQTQSGNSAAKAPGLIFGKEADMQL